jgi:hypothetical protein
MLAALSALVFVASLFVGVPATLYLSNREEARRRWRPRPMELVAVGDGSYRGAEVTRLEALGPPAHVHLTAVMCWVLGMAFVPGLLAGLYGFFFLWVGLVSVPGLVLAMRLLRLGGPLLRGEAEAVPKARAAARFARGLNYVVLGLVAALTLAYAPWRPRIGDPPVPWVLGGLASIALYAAISLLHARLLDRSAGSVEAEVQARLVEAAGVRVAVAASPAEDAARADDAAVDAAAAPARRRAG